MTALPPSSPSWQDRIRHRLALARRRRAALIAAQQAILRNQDAEEDAGITWETDEYGRLHVEYWQLRRAMTWWEAFGVFEIASARNNRRGTASGADQ